MLPLECPSHLWVPLGLNILPGVSDGPSQGRDGAPGEVGELPSVFPVPLYVQRSVRLVIAFFLVEKWKQNLLYHLPDCTKCVQRKENDQVHLKLIKQNQNIIFQEIFVSN